VGARSALADEHDIAKRTPCLLSLLLAATKNGITSLDALTRLFEHRPAYPPRCGSWGKAQVRARNRFLRKVAT
jgi:hypothetical protein